MPCSTSRPQTAPTHLAPVPVNDYNKLRSNHSPDTNHNFNTIQLSNARDDTCTTKQFDKQYSNRYDTRKTDKNSPPIRDNCTRADRVNFSSHVCADQFDYNFRNRFTTDFNDAINFNLSQGNFPLDADESKLQQIKYKCNQENSVNILRQQKEPHIDNYIDGDSLERYKRSPKDTSYVNYSYNNNSQIHDDLRTTGELADKEHHVENPLTAYQSRQFQHNSISDNYTCVLVEEQTRRASKVQDGGNHSPSPGISLSFQRVVLDDNRDYFCNTSSKTRDSAISLSFDADDSRIQSSGIDADVTDHDLLRGSPTRMSTNDSDRSRQPCTPGNSDNITSWRAHAATTSPGQRVPDTMMLTGPRLTPAADMGMFAAGHGDASSRLYLSGSHYHYSTSAATRMYSPAMYTLHGGQPVSTHLGSRYAYYPHYYAANYPHIPYPHIESYSAVLASMGSQVQQHASQSVPRVPYLPPAPPPPPSSHIPPHYSGLASASGAKVPSHRHKPDYPKPFTKSESWSASDFHSHMFGHPISKDSAKRGGGSSTAVRPFHHPRDPPSSSSTSLAASADPIDYKVPSGKEGSMKHRILTRPPEHSVSIAHYDMDAPPPRSLLRTTTPTSVNLHYPPHFMRGSIIELANSQLKCVEELQTEDFVHSADVSPDLKIDSSTVVKIEQDSHRGTVLLGFSVGQHRVQVTVEASLEHPFFVFGQGWSSCSPERTLQRYGLECQLLSVGDVCISLTHKDVITHAASLQKRQRQQQQPESSSSPSTQSTTTTAAVSETTRKSPVSASPASSKRAHIQFAAPDTLPQPVKTEPVKTEPAMSGDGDVKPVVEDTPGDNHAPEADPSTSPVASTVSRKRRWSAPDEAAEINPSPPTTAPSPQQSDKPASPSPESVSSGNSKPLKEDNNNNT